jgi:hypothetical protein
MSETTVVLQSTTIDKTSFEKVVDSKITTFIDRVDTTSELTVEQFFAEYERLYFTIPINGTTQSHEYLIKKSSELVRVDNLQDIQPLLDEIATLREQLLEVTSENIQLQNREL